MNIIEHVSLADHTTLRVGGRARYYTVVASSAELVDAVEFARAKNVPFFVLGNGSNVLISDDDIEALVIRIAPAFDGANIAYTPYKKGVLCVVGAGESWDDVVADAVSRGYGGIENLALIPGTAGGAVVQNIGAYGAEIKDVLEWVEVLDTAAGKVERLSLNDCAFGYRSSIFKTPPGKKYIVLRVALCLASQRDGYVPNISYKDVAAYFPPGAMPSLEEVREAVIAIRRAKLPDPKEIPNAGSFFKNPVVSLEQAHTLAERFPGIPLFLVSDTERKTSAAWLIDKACGLKGVERYGVTTYITQPLVIINPHGACAHDIDMFADMIVTTVYEKTGVTLEREVEHVSNKNFSVKK